MADQSEVFIFRSDPSSFCYSAPAEPAVPPWTSPSSPGAGGRSDPGISAGPRTSFPSPLTLPRRLRSLLWALWCSQLSLAKDAASAGVAALYCRRQVIRRDTWMMTGKSSSPRCPVGWNTPLRAAPGRDQTAADVAAAGSFGTEELWGARRHRGSQ